MAVTQKNRARYRGILISREVKWLLMAVPSRFQDRLRSWLWRWLFKAADGQVHRTGEIVLADLSAFCTGQPAFSPDPLTMARRAGRREVFDRILIYLELDERFVGQLMEIDDGLE